MALKKDDDKALARSEQTVTDEKKHRSRGASLCETDSGNEPTDFVLRFEGRERRNRWGAERGESRGALRFEV